MPGARPFSTAQNFTEHPIPFLIRKFVPGYFGADEPLGIALADSPDALDLQQRLDRLSHLGINTLRFTRCRIKNICKTPGVSSRYFMIFDDCEFSELAAVQKQQLVTDIPPFGTAARFYYSGNLYSGFQ